MNPTMKQWKQLVLVGMLAWIILFLALFSYFMDSPVEGSRSSSLSHTETRRLSSLPAQGPRWVSGVAPRPRPFSSPLAPPSPPLDWNRDQRAQKSREEEEEASPDLQMPAAGRKLPARNAFEENKEWMRRRRRRRRNKGGQRWQAAEDLEDYYFSKSKSVMDRLREGNVSAGMLSLRLQKAMNEYMSNNKHRVDYSGRRRTRLSGRELVCELKRRVRVRTLDGTEAPFSALGWDTLVPPLPLEKLGSAFRSCSVVTSAGAILRSSLGKEIDSHDAVLRFNAAPVKGYESDVGNKTTIRIINSQILAKAKYRFNTSALYQGVSLVAWDPAPYAVNLQRWFRSPDYDLFSPYTEYRRRHPKQPFYILHPAFIWQLWDIIQANTQENIQPNPPSSGFIGIVLMMALCDKVDVYEYIPSLRQTDLCHYYERYHDMACTLGAYHPLLYEKVLVQRMSTGPKDDVRTKGKVTLPGFRTVDCDP